MANNYRVLDLIARDFKFKRERDYALGETGGFLISVIKDKTLVNEVNFVFKKLDFKGRTKLDSYIKKIQKEFNISKFRIKNENLSLVIPAMKDEDKEYIILKNLLTKLTEDLPKIAEGKTLDSTLDEIDELKGRLKSDEKDKKSVNELIGEFLRNPWTCLIISLFLLTILWLTNLNGSPFNYVIAFLTPFIIYYFVKQFSKEAFSLKYLLNISVVYTFIMVYITTVLRKYSSIRTAIPDFTLSDALYNVNIGIIDNSTGTRWQIITPLLLCPLIVMVGAILVRSIEVARKKKEDEEREVIKSMMDRKKGKGK